MNALWIVVVIGLFAALAKGIAWAYELAGPSALGFVSHRWRECRGASAASLRRPSSAGVLRLSFRRSR